MTLVRSSYVKSIMSKMVWRLRIGRSTLYRKLEVLDCAMAGDTCG
jgi:hypothetical protein